MSEHPANPAHVNMADVARRAGVSIATVSRALRGLPGVSEATRERVHGVAEELAYVVSPEASRLSRRDTGRVAVVVPKIDSWFYGSMLAGIESALRRADLDVLVYQVDGPEERRRFFHQLPARRKVDAVVLIALPLLPEEEERLDLLGVQVVVAGGRLRDHPHVEVDDHAVAVRAVEHLIELGHTRIAMIRTDDVEGTTGSSDALRTRGFHDTLAAHGVPDRADYVVTAPAGVRAGADAMGRLLDHPEPPTAVFCYSDELAVSALRTLLERGLEVPCDLSLIGVDGHPTAELFGISTVDQSVREQAETAGDMALALIRGEELPRTSVVVGSTLVLRSSTAAPSRPA